MVGGVIMFFDRAMCVSSVILVKQKLIPCRLAMGNVRGGTFQQKFN